MTTGVFDERKKPFFWMDTAWELFHRLDREKATYYLKKRSNQDFIVIQTAALAEIDGLNKPNSYGVNQIQKNHSKTIKSNDLILRLLQ